MKRLKGNNKGIKLVEILLAVLVAILVISKAVPIMLRFIIASKASYAEESLKSIARAAEEYARYHEGNYPLSIASLISDKYLDHDYTAHPTNGYKFNCSWSEKNYSCSARPLLNVDKGNFTFTVKSRKDAKNKSPK